MLSAGLYIHIPFCNIKCIYCDFYSVVDQESTIPDFFKALFNEFLNQGLMRFKAFSK